MTRLYDQHVVLLMDADALVGMDLEDTMERAGYRVLGPLATTLEALSLLERETPTLAIIDVVLRDGPCFVLVQELRRRGVPFLVHTGCEPNAPMAGEFLGAPWLNKPALSTDVVTLCAELALTKPNLAPDRQILPPIVLSRSGGGCEPLVP
ncbi:MAG: response regulator [Methylobacterium sp.]|uniref:response regulator n=1 Tax=Methylobacterium sp. TaxID=409 RepID=UPI0027167185|nr:response regulator [Methylobacterium sp.]MDO9428844.1 response regulator [Methylobacterium sp.]